MSGAGRYTDIVLDEKERPRPRGEQPVEHPERDELLGRVSPEAAGWSALLGFIVALLFPLLGLFAGLGVIFLGAAVIWWEPDRWGRRAGKAVIGMGVLIVALAASILYFVPAWGLR